MKRIALLGALALLGCGSPAAPTDMAPSVNDLPLPLPDLTGLSPGPDFAAIPDFALVPDMVKAPTEDLLAMADMVRPPDMALPGYPPGPYGNNVGDTIGPSLQWEGYLNPTAVGLATKAPYGLLSMNDLHNSGNKFALLYAADFW